MHPSQHASPALLLARSDVRRALSMRECIAALDRAFRNEGEGRRIPAGVLGTHVADGGFHVKTAAFLGDSSYFAAKVNANFPSNPSQRGLPTVQGILVLFDAACGRPLAVMDSAEVTRLRTAAASALAAQYLARQSASTLGICGCGVQGRAHVEAMRVVRPITRITACDADRARARAFADAVGAEDGVMVEVVDSPAEAARGSDIVVTCTPSTAPMLFSGHVSPGTFVAAVGADAEHKNELDPALMRRSAVVCDVLSQCATIGDLHHAIDAGVMTIGDVRAELADVVTAGGLDSAGEDDVIIFDSTGTALEDVAAAAIVYERARDWAAVTHFDFSV